MMAEFNHPVLIVLVAAVFAPLLAEVPIGIRIPVVVIEIVLGIIIGPHVLGWVRFDGVVASMFTLGMGATLFMAGMDLDFGRIRGRPLLLALGGWAISLTLGVAAAALLYVTPMVHAPMMVVLALTTTSLGTLLPILRDSNVLDTRFGRLFFAAGTVGELGPIVAMSLLLSQRFSTWHEVGFLLVFLGIVLSAAVVGMDARPPKVVALLSRTMQASSQLPVRVALLIFGAFFVLSETFGFENILGAFAAGMVVGLATRGDDGRPLRNKIDAVMLGWFSPFFFVGMGIRFDIVGTVGNLETALLVPAFLVLFLLVRGVPVVLYRKDLEPEERVPFGLLSSVASLSIVVVITEIGVRTGHISHDIATALVGAAVLAALLFPTIAGALLERSKRTRVQPM